MLRNVIATRYVTPLREGGSVPAIVEGDDGGLHVVKFRGAGQGPRALIAELLAGEVARQLGLRVPELVFIDFDLALSRSEPDEEIREQLKASAGLNLALDYLPGSLTFDPLADAAPTREVASSMVWFDAFVTNVDRTAKNPNLLTWHRDLWLIDHGAALYFHHAWDDPLRSSESPFAPIRDHVLLPWASALREADAALRPRLSRAYFEALVQEIPDAWLAHDSPFPDAAAHREAYVRFLEHRLASSQRFVEEAARAHAQLV